MMQVVIQPTKSKNKTLEAVIDGKKTVPFGQKNASDFTLNKNVERKARYINRHKKNERWDDPTTAGFYSRWVLWNQPTLQKSVNDIKKRFPHLQVKLQQ